MGYPRKVESLWTEGDYVVAIEAHREEWARYKRKHPHSDAADRLYEREIKRLEAARLALAKREKS